MILYPSEVDRLVLGYLNEQKFFVTAEVFLTESPHLEEHRKLIKTGKVHPLTVNGKTLVDYLDQLDCEEDLRGRKKKSRLSGSSKRIVHVEKQTDSLSLTHDGGGLQIGVDKSSDEESVHEVPLGPNEEYIICPFTEQPSLALKITDSFLVSDELFDSQSFPNVNSQNKVARQWRKSSSPRKLLTDSLVYKKQDNYERYWSPDRLKKYIVDMVFLNQLLCDHPVVQKIAYTINKVKKNKWKRGKNLPPSIKDSVYFEELVKETVTEIESNIFVQKYFDFLCYRRDSCMSFRKSRCPNFDGKKLSTVSSKAHAASHLNLEKYVAEDSTVRPLKIIPEAISGTKGTADFHLKNLHSNAAKADNNLSATENIILGALNDENNDESTLVDDDSCDIQNSAYEASEMPSDVNEKNTSRDVNEILSDQSDGNLLPVVSQQEFSNIFVEENTTSISEVMMPAELLEKENSGWKQSQPISEETDNIQPANFQNTISRDLSLNGANIDECISVVHDSSNVQNSTNITSGVPSQLYANKKSTSNIVKEIFSDDPSSSEFSQPNISDIIMEENTTSKSEVVMNTELLEKQNSRWLTPEKKHNIQPADIQSRTLMDLSLNVTNIVEPISVAHDSSDIQNSVNERTTVPSKLDVNQTSISNNVNEILPVDQTDDISLPINFQQKINDIIMNQIINGTSQSEVMMHSELLNTKNSPQKSLLISKDSGNVRSPNFSNSTSRYAPIMTFQNNDFSQPSNPFITPQFPSALLNSLFMSNTSSTYFIQDNFIYKIVMGPNVNSASSLNSNLFEASSGINNCTQGILNLPVPTSNSNSLASSGDFILPASSSCSLLSTTSVLSSSSNNTIVPTFSNNLSTGVLSNAQPASLSNTSLTASNNVLTVPSNGIILSAPPGNNNLPLLTNIANVPLCSTTQLNTNGFHIPAPDNGNIAQIPINSPHSQPASLSNTSLTASNNVLTVPSNGIILSAPPGNNNLPLLTNIANVPLCSTTQLNTNSFHIPALDNGNIAQIPISSSHVTGIVGALQDVELIISDGAENAGKESTRSLQDFEKPIVSADKKKSMKAKKGKSKDGKGKKSLPKNNHETLSSSEICLKKNQHCQRPTRNIIRCPLFPFNPNLENYATVNLVEPVLPSKEPNLSTSSNQHNVVPDVTKNPSYEEENVIDETRLLHSSKTYLGRRTSTSNSTVKNTYSENGPLSIQVDSESNDSILKHKNPVSTTSELEKGFEIRNILKCTNSYVNTANDKMPMPLVDYVDSTTLNSTYSDVDSSHGETIIPSKCLTSSSAPSSGNSYVDVANNEITNSDCAINSDILNGINSDVIIMDNDVSNQTTMFLESYTNLTFSNGMNSHIDEASGQTTVSLSSSKDCAQFSNTAFDFMINCEMDEEDIPLSELKNQKFHEQSSHLKISSIRVCAEVSNTASDNTENEEDIPLSELKNQKFHEQSSHLKASSIRVCAEASNATSDNTKNEEDILAESQYKKAHVRKSFKKLQKSSGSIKAHKKLDHTRSYESFFTSEEFSQCSNTLEDNCNSAKGSNKSEDAPVSSSYSSILNSLLFSPPEKCTSKQISPQAKNVCEISSVPKHLRRSSDGSGTEASNLSLCSSVIACPKDTSKLQNNINSVSSDAFQSNDLSVETLDNKHIFLSQTDNGCFKKIKDNHPVSRKCENSGDLDQNIKTNIKRRKSSSNETLKRKLLKRFTKKTEYTSHSDLSNLKTNDKTSPEISNFLSETENLHVIPTLPQHLNSCIENKTATNNSPHVPLLLKDGAQIQNTLCPLTAESFESDNSPERLANTDAFLDPADNSYFKQAVSNLDQSIKLSKRKKRKNSLKETSKRKSLKKFSKQEKIPSYSELANLKTNEKCRVKDPFNSSVEMENLHSIPSLHAHFSSICSETQVKNLSTHLLPEAPIELQNSLIPVTSETFPSDDSSSETTDNILAFLSSTDIKDNYGISRESKEAITDKVENQNIRSSKVKVLHRHFRKQSNPKKVTSLRGIGHKLKKHSKKGGNRKCKVKETKNLIMQKTYQAQSLKAFASRSSTGKINGMKEILEEDLLNHVTPKNKNAPGYALDIKESQKMCKAKKQNSCKLSSKKQKSVKAKLNKSSKESLGTKQMNTETFDCINNTRNLNCISDQNNLDLDEKHEIITSLNFSHKEMVLFPMKKRMVFDYLKKEYLKRFNNFFQKMLLLIRYIKEVGQFYFEIKKIVLFKFISQKNQNGDLLAKYLDGKLQIKNLKTNSALLKSALDWEDSDKSPSIDIFKRICCEISEIQQEFERRFKFGMHSEKMEIKKNSIIKYVDLHLLHLELHSIKESLVKKSSISKEKVYSFEDPVFSLESELFFQQPIVLLERLKIPSRIRNIIDGTESQSCERNTKDFNQTVSIKNLVSSSVSESQKPFLANLLNVRGTDLKKPSGMTIMSSLISFNDGNVWPDEFKNKIITIFETTMDIALLVNNILYNICEYSCDISKFVLGNNFPHQNMPHSLLVDSSAKKSNSLGELPLLDETIVSPAEDLTNGNDVEQRNSHPKWQTNSLEDLSFSEQISKALGDLKNAAVDNRQNSIRTHETSDFQNEISSCIVKSEAKKESCKSMEKYNFYPQQDSGKIRNKYVVRINTSKKVKQNNKEFADLEMSRKSRRSNKLNSSNCKKRQDSKVTNKKISNSFRKSHLNSLPNAHILSESKKLERCAPLMNTDKEHCLTSQEAVDNESFRTISDSLSDSSSNTFIYWPTSTDKEHLDFKIEESTDHKELHTESERFCASAKGSTEQTKILEGSISKITCMNLNEEKCNFNDKIPVPSNNDKSKTWALNSFKENGNPCVTPGLAETCGETSMDVLNGTTEANLSQNISQKSCMPSTKKSKSKKEIVPLCKSSLKNKNSKSVLKSESQGSPRESSSSLPQMEEVGESQGSPRESSSSLSQMEEVGESQGSPRESSSSLPQMEEVDESSTSSSSSKFSLKFLYDTDEFLAVLGEKSVTEKRRKSAEIVRNSILKLGIEGFTAALRPLAT